MRIATIVIATVLAAGAGTAVALLYLKPAALVTTAPPNAEMAPATLVAYVEVDEEDGRRHVRGVIRQLQKISEMGLVPLDRAYVERLRKAQRGAVYVYFGDDPGSETACLSTAVIPGEALYFVYSSRRHADAAYPLLLRCASALDYEIIET